MEWQFGQRAGGGTRNAWRATVRANKSLVVCDAACIVGPGDGDWTCKQVHGYVAGGTMTNSRLLDEYIVRLRERLRLGAWLRGAAIFTGTALAVTLALVLLLNHFAFPSRALTTARIALIIILAAVAILG